MATKRNKRGFRRVLNALPKTVRASRGVTKKASRFFTAAKKKVRSLPSWLDRTASALIRRVSRRRR